MQKRNSQNEMKKKRNFQDAKKGISKIKKRKLFITDAKEEFLK